MAFWGAPRPDPEALHPAARRLSSPRRSTGSRCRPGLGHELRVPHRHQVHRGRRQYRLLDTAQLHGARRHGEPREPPQGVNKIYGTTIKPGKALAYLDWSAEEIAIAAVLSGDQRLLEVVSKGDPYLGFARLAGLAPADATKDTSRDPRTLQDALLGVGYGVRSPRSPATSTAASEARQLLRLYRETFPAHRLDRSAVRPGNSHRWIQPCSAGGCS